MTEELIEDSALTKYEYRTFGPFPLSSTDDLSSTSIAKKFWDGVDKKHDKLLSAAIGVYVFAVKATKKSAYMPWYVGLTHKGFKRRFGNHKRLFAKLLSKRGRLSVFLIARIDRDSTEFMKSRKYVKSSDILETMLIERCVELNPQLFNALKVKHVKGLVVPGFKPGLKGKKVGAPRASAREFSLLLNGKPSEES
jgi:hypothetical protein